MIKTTVGMVCLLMLGIFASQVRAEPVTDDLPAISIIIDDLGSDNSRHERVVRLPGAIACSFLPQLPATRRLALIAHSYNKEIMLHLPMESVEHKPLGPGGLTLDMTQHEFMWTLQKDLESVPHVMGINNHMGSLLTRHPGHMVWLMKEMKRNGKLFFVDSRTTSESIAKTVADEQGVPGLQREVFLDHDQDKAAVQKQFDRTIELARKHGTAVAIGHPYESTLQVLEKMLPKLQRLQVRLVPVSEMIKLKQERNNTWQASLSPLQRDVKN